MTPTAVSLKAYGGCWLHERWRTECALNPALSRVTGLRWVDLRNRHERLLPGSDSGSRVCDWADSSVLTVARVFPRVGGRLLGRCLHEWPIVLATTPPPPVPGSPLLSVVLPVGGADRVEQFRAVVHSLWGQSERRIEIIAVEHAEAPIYQAHCPPSVRHIHLPRCPGGQFNKSAAMNAGVRQASADAILLHDADVVVPRDYVRSVLDRLAVGWDAVRPVRFLFHLDQQPSEDFAAGRPLPRDAAVVQQNNPGISTAVRREVYWDIGGHDERFEGWGGEDAEFLDRLRTRALFSGAYASAIHLWHPAAPKKASGDRNAGVLSALLTQSTASRIAALRSIGHE